MYTQLENGRIATSRMMTRVEFAAEFTKLAISKNVTISADQLSVYWDVLKGYSNLSKIIKIAILREFKRAFPSVAELVEIDSEINRRPQNDVGHQQIPPPKISDMMALRVSFCGDCMRAGFNPALIYDLIERGHVAVPEAYRDRENRTRDFLVEILEKGPVPLEDLRLKRQGNLVLV